MVRLLAGRAAAERALLRARENRDFDALTGGGRVVASAAEALDFRPVAVAPAPTGITSTGPPEPVRMVGA